MKTKFNNPELAHIWANQQQSHGSGSSMFFEGSTIYSYGYHFKIAQFIENKEGQKCIFLNYRSYSNTTNKHQSLVWRALPPNIPFFRVSDFFNDPNYATGSHKENLTHYVNEAEKLQKLTKNAHKLKMSYLEQLKNQIDIFEKYCSFFDLQDLTKFNPILGQGLTLKERYEKLTSFILVYENSEELKRWQIKQEENKKKAEEKALIEAKEKIEAFRQFKISSIYANIGYQLLRYNNDTQMIETSGGVKMHGLIFLKAYNRLINNELSKGQHVDSYVFGGISNDFVLIGCHKIPMTEINNVVSCMP